MQQADEALLGQVVLLRDAEEAHHRQQQCGYHVYIHVVDGIVRQPQQEARPKHEAEIKPERLVARADAIAQPLCPSISKLLIRRQQRWFQGFIVAQQALAGL